MTFYLDFARFPLSNRALVHPQVSQDKNEHHLEGMKGQSGHSLRDTSKSKHAFSSSFFQALLFGNKTSLAPVMPLNLRTLVNHWDKSGGIVLSSRLSLTHHNKEEYKGKILYFPKAEMILGDLKDPQTVDPQKPMYYLHMFKNADHMGRGQYRYGENIQAFFTGDKQYPRLVQVDYKLNDVSLPAYEGERQLFNQLKQMKIQGAVQPLHVGSMNGDLWKHLIHKEKIVETVGRNSEAYFETAWSPASGYGSGATYVRLVYLPQPNTGKQRPIKFLEAHHFPVSQLSDHIPKDRPAWVMVMEDSIRGRNDGYMAVFDGTHTDENHPPKTLYVWRKTKPSQAEPWVGYTDEIFSQISRLSLQTSKPLDRLQPMRKYGDHQWGLYGDQARFLQKPYEEYLKRLSPVYPKPDPLPFTAKTEMGTFEGKIQFVPKDTQYVIEGSFTSDLGWRSHFGGLPEKTIFKLQSHPWFLPDYSDKAPIRTLWVDRHDSRGLQPAPQQLDLFTELLFNPWTQIQLPQPLTDFHYTPDEARSITLQPMLKKLVLENSYGGPVKIPDGLNWSWDQLVKNYVWDRDDKVPRPVMMRNLKTGEVGVLYPPFEKNPNIQLYFYQQKRHPELDDPFPYNLAIASFDVKTGMMTWASREDASSKENLVALGSSIMEALNSRDLEFKQADYREEQNKRWMYLGLPKPTGEEPAPDSLQYPPFMKLKEYVQAQILKNPPEDHLAFDFKIETSPMTLVLSDRLHKGTQYRMTFDPKTGVVSDLRVKSNNNKHSNYWYPMQVGPWLEPIINRLVEGHAFSVSQAEAEEVHANSENATGEGDKI